MQKDEVRLDTKDCVCLDSLGQEGLCYEWHELRVYKNNLTGQLGYGEGAGCSCYGWGDDFYYFSDLNPIDADWEGFAKVVKDFPADACTKTEFLSLVRKELKK